MKRRLAVVLMLLACSISAGAAQRAKGRTHTVKIEGMLFKPSALTIKAGDTVVWQNTDIVEHTATSTAGNGFDSKLLAAGKSWKHRFTAKGVFDYVCKYHPTMKGSLAVK